MVKQLKLPYRYTIRFNSAAAAWLAQVATNNTMDIAEVIRQSVDQTKARAAGGLVVEKESALYRYLLSQHFVGQTADGKPFLYCPTAGLPSGGGAISWHPDDAANKYCPHHKQFFNEMGVQNA